jgi:diguanylate cyclase
MPNSDPLTGLLTRQELETELKKAIEQAKAAETPLSLAITDIDYFKALNERHGHATGDAVIQAIAGAVSKAAGKGVTVARYGGEEFVLLFRNTEREQALLVTERVRLEIEKPRKIAGPKGKLELALTISGGVAAFPLDGRRDGELIRKADQALYRAKATGRNKICLAQEERMVTKTTHYPQTQLERLSKLVVEAPITKTKCARCNPAHLG